MRKLPCKTFIHFKRFSEIREPAEVNKSKNLRHYLNNVHKINFEHNENDPNSVNITEPFMNGT